MTWLSLVLALLLEQFRPISAQNPILGAYTLFTDQVERNFNAGSYRHGVIAWTIAVAVPALIVVLLCGLLYLIHPLLTWVFSIGVLYLTMGFRQFSHAFSGIAEALKDGDLPVARRALAAWTRQSTSELDHNEVSRVATEQGLIDSYRYVFGPVFWFVLLGPIGVVVYRAATILQQRWGSRPEAEGERFGEFARQAAEAIDWLPIRATAASFAIVGDFEDAVYCWRQQAQSWINHTYGILLAAGAGAIGVRLGLPLHQDYTVKFRPELGTGEDADPNTLTCAVGLVWRTVLFWLALLLLLTLASWF
ncbi:CobD/CbiB family protein [Chitinimonas lacunae]|uniref:Cobalamin biosynthesis protein CobD n=1 Tax=Chitinimonas lacunae TaxID=1963018 RepID=A0ABV8MSA1_9NEIS